MGEFIKLRPAPLLQEPCRAFLSARMKADGTPCKYHMFSAVKLKPLRCVLNRVITHFFREKDSEFRSSVGIFLFDILKGVVVAFLSFVRLAL